MAESKNKDELQALIDSEVAAAEAADVVEEIVEKVVELTNETDEDPLQPARLASALKSPSHDELNPGFAL